MIRACPLTTGGVGAGGSVPARNHSRRPGSEPAGKVTWALFTPGGADGAALGTARCSRAITSVHTGAAPVTPLTLRIGSPEKFPTHTPTAVAARVAHAPVVAHLLAGLPVFTALQNRVASAFLEAERRAPALAVGQDAGHEEGGRLGVDALAGAHGVPGAHPQRAPDATAGKRAVGVHQLPQAHVGRAQRHREPIVLPRLRESVEVKPAELLDGGLLAEQVERPDGRHVERRAERRARAHQPLNSSS